MPPEGKDRLRSALWLGLLILLIGAAMFLAGNLRHPALNPGWGPVARDNPGLLSMEPPQVYTRERLVNDRFREATWLNRQLDETTAQGRERLSQSSASSARSDRTVITGSVMGATATAPEAAAAAAPATALDELELFRRQADYRELLRNDLMDTLLDDGHDLDGNTLYRLNFDAVALPWRDRRRDPGSAVFVVKMTSPYAGMTAQADEADEATKRRRIRDDLALMRDWQRDMQVFLSKVLELRAQAFNATGAVENPVDPKESLAFDRYMRLQLVESFLRLAAKMGDSRACTGGAVGYDLLAMLTVSGELSARADHCDIWQDTPARRAATIGTPSARARAERAITRARMEQVAIWTGFDWRRDAPSAEAPSAQVTEGLLRGITAAQDINRVRTTTSVEWLKLQSDIDGLRQQLGQMKQAQQKARPASAANAREAEMAQLEELMQSMLRQQAQMTRVANDENQGRATIRVIAALNALEDVLPQLALLPADAGRFTGIDVGLPRGAGAPPDKVMAFLREFIKLQPRKTDVDAYATELLAGIPDQVLDQLSPRLPDQLRATGSGQAGGDAAPPAPDAVQPVRDAAPPAQGAAQPAADAAPREYLPQDRCLYDYRQAGRADPMDYGLCMFLRAPAGAEVKDQMAQFLLARLKGRLEGYEGLEVPISQFVDVRLSGCAFGGCRIEVQPYAGLTHDSAGVAETNRTVQRAAGAIIGNLPETDALTARSGFPVARLSAAEIPGLLNHLGLSDAAAGDSLTAAQETLRLCLTLAAFGEEKGLVPEAGAVYHACMLREWVEARRSDVAVYGVSPRILGTVEQALDQSSTGIGLAGQTGGGSAGLSLGAARGRAGARTQLQAGVIGFSQLPLIPGADTEPPRTEHTVFFGWAVRPQPAVDGEGWAPAHHRLSAVVAVPSWWRWLDFTVEACWISPARARAQRNLESAPERICYGLPKEGWTRENGTDPTMLKPEGGAEVLPDLVRSFAVQLPRRVDDITERFNFDFIKTPYWDSDWLSEVDTAPDLLSMEIGRPGRLVLAGERLWRGTVVTMNNQIADSIVVLPDMNGVIAEFRCVHAPPGFAGVIADPERLQTWSRRPPPPIQVPVRVWTSEGRTQTRPVQLLPFMRRTPADTPCDPANPGGAATDPAAWAGFVPKGGAAE